MSINDPAAAPDPVPQLRNQKAERTLLLLLLLVPLIVLKLWFDPGLGVGTDDGNYYYQIARNFSEGQGLRTSVSLYHQGLRDLPERITVPPLWPWLLGTAARAVTLDFAAAALPEALWLIALVLLYFVTERAFPHSAFGATGGVVRLAHVVVLLFGLNPIFFRYSSAPYNEPLAFVLLFAALILLARTERTASWRWAAAAGVACGLAYLARYQMLAAVSSLLALLVVRAVFDRRFLRPAVALATAAGSFVAASVLYRLTIVPRFTLSTLYDFNYQDLPPIPRSAGRQVEGLLGFIADRAPGTLVAFNPSNYLSYLTSFSAAAWLVPLSLVLLLSPAVRSRVGPALLGRRNLAAAAMVWSGVALVLPVHLAHPTRFGEWLFGGRHGLYLILLIIPACALLLRELPQVAKALILAVLLASMLTGGTRIMTLGSGEFPYAPKMPWRMAAGFLDAQPVVPVVVTTNPQTFSVLSRARFHWLACDDGPAHVRALIDVIGVDYFAVLPDDRDCSFREALANEAQPAKIFGAGSDAVVLYRPTRGALSAGNDGL